MKYIKEIFTNFIRKIVRSELESLDDQININLENDVSVKKNSFEIVPNTEDLFYSNYGYTKKMDHLDFETRQKIYIHFQYQEKSKVALSVVSSYRGGHYLEFGSHGLNTFKNFLAAFYVAELEGRFPDTHFYAFDIFGSVDELDVLNLGGMIHNREWEKTQTEYFKPFLTQGDLIKTYSKNLLDYNLFYSKTHLIKGLFNKTLNNFELDNKIGFVFLDCNILPSYQVVLDWLEFKISDYTYIYVGEYFDQPEIYNLFEEFRGKLKKRKLNLGFVRSAASVGALFRCFKIN